MPGYFHYSIFSNFEINSSDYLIKCQRQLWEKKKGGGDEGGGASRVESYIYVFPFNIRSLCNHM